MRQGTKGGKQGTVKLDKGQEKGTGERMTEEKTWFNTNKNEFPHMLSHATSNRLPRMLSQRVTIFIC
jgi:hypothetical protein